MHNVFMLNVRVHHDDVDDTSMTYGTRHNDKRPKDGSDLPGGSSSQDAGDDLGPSQAAPPKKDTQVLINFASDQVRFCVFILQISIMISISIIFTIISVLG